MEPKNKQKFESYVGKTVDEVKLLITKDYPDMYLVECDNNDYWYEVYYENGIRALVVDNIIQKISFG